MSTLPNIYVNGNVVETINGPIRGLISISGNVFGNSQCNYGGKIHISGNSGGIIGYYAHGGEIIVDGHAGYKIGFGMTGGIIHLNGDYSSISKEMRGDIYHKGQQIIKCGKPVTNVEINWE